MSEAVQDFLLAAKGELKWMYCPVCMDRQDHLKSDQGWRCTRCGTVHSLKNDKPKDKEVRT